VTGYDPASWTDFSVAQAGASAALTGLLFVAMSINLDNILETDGLPSRAAETLVFLMNILLVATLILVPQRSQLLGAEILVISGAAWVAISSAKLRAPTPHSDWRRAYYLNVVAGQLAMIPFLIGGVTLLAGSGGGLFWVAPGVVLSLVVAVLNAWVLMVEILR
jgi:modulator of FtsH protease